MNRHRIEPGRLLLGALLLVVAMTYVMRALGEWEVPLWLLLVVVPVALAMAGFTALVTLVVRRRLERRRGVP